MLDQPLFFTGCLYPVLELTPIPLTQLVRPHLVALPSLCSPCVT